MRLIPVLVLALGCPTDTDKGGDTADTAAGTDTGGDDTGDTGDTAADTADTADTSALRTCDDVLADFSAETSEIRYCEAASECGQQLTGTSCGCTRDWVARLDADTTEFYELIGEAAELSCDLGLDSECDCPEAYGFDCIDNVCDWDFKPPAGGALPACEAADGYDTTVNGINVIGDDLVVNLSYGGGCSTHSFSLCWPDQSFMESSPVQVDLELLHEADAPDPCDAWISEEVYLDLVPLRDAYTASYGGGSATVVVHLGGFSVDYSW